MRSLSRIVGYARGLLWAVAAVRRARRQVREAGLGHIGLRLPPSAGRGTLRGVADGVRLARANCLERSLVRRRWYLAQGRDIPIVIGVRKGPGEAFGAHAWLQGDPPDPAEFLELTVWPEPGRDPVGRPSG